MFKDRCSWLAPFSVPPLLLLAFGLAHADSTFTFQIVSRVSSTSPPATGPFPTGLFKMTLETSGPVVGAKVSVGGASCAIPASGDCHFNTSTGDRVSASQDSGNPNNAIINYSPLSQLAPPSPSYNFCSPATAPGVGAVLETVTMTFTGPTITGYRRNTYTPGNSLDCDQAFLRVDSNPVTFTTPPSGADLGRNPLDIVLVLDNSGSMALPAATPEQAAPWDTRWNVLNQVVSMFLATWAQSNAVTSAGNAVDGSANDRIGLVFYSTAQEPASYPPGTPGAQGIFISRGTSASPWTLVSNAVAAQGPTNLTAIGLGLTEAICDAKQEPAGNTNDQQLILMTDGEQNVAPLLQPDPPVAGMATVLDFAATSTCPAATAVPLSSKLTPIQTVALGTPGTVDTSLLNAISTQTAGNTNMAWTPTDIATGFTDTLMDALKGNTLDLNTRVEGTLAATASSSAAIPLLLDGSVRRTTMVLGWQNQSNGLDLQITSPSGTIITPAARQYTPFWTVQSIDLPASGPAGAWSVQVVRSAKGDPVRGTQAVSAPYFLSIYSVEGKLGYKLKFTSLSPGTGNPIGLDAEVSYNGTPLTGLGNAIKVQIERPNAGLGTALYNSNVPASVLTSEPDPHDITTPYQRKVAYLTSNNGLIGTIAPQPIPTQYALVDDGKTSQDGDISANDGTYSALFADTTSPGLYKFHVTMEWDNPTTGKIHREETLQVQVAVTPDPTASIVSVTQGSIAGSWSMTVTPKDKYGNYLGPGFSPSFNVAVNGGGSVSGPLVDTLQTGSYVINLVGVPANTDPTVTITVGGTTILNCKLMSCTSGGSVNGNVLSKWWWLILLLILLILLIAWLIRRAKHP
jgi:hypothetical protein